MADMEKVYDNFIIINLYLVFGFVISDDGGLFCDSREEESFLEQSWSLAQKTVR